MRSKNRLFWTVWVWVLAAPALSAQPRAPAWVAWQFQGENDAIGSFSGTDEFYTQGLRFTVQRNPRRLPESFVELGGSLWELLYPDRPVEVGLGIEIGHHIFTPGDLQAKELIEDLNPPPTCRETHPALPDGASRRPCGPRGTPRGHIAGSGGG